MKQVIQALTSGYLLGVLSSCVLETAPVERQEILGAIDGCTDGSIAMIHPDGTVECTNASALACEEGYLATENGEPVCKSTLDGLNGGSLSGALNILAPDLSGALAVRSGSEIGPGINVIQQNNEMPAGIFGRQTSSPQTGDVLQVWSTKSDASGTLFAVRNGATWEQDGTWSGGHDAFNISTDGFVGIGTGEAEAMLDVAGSIKSTIGVTNGTPIALARPHSSYLINVSSNYDSGASVRSGLYHVLLSEDETPVVFESFEINTLNNQTATFGVSGGMLIISGLSLGNTKVSVIEN